MSVAFGDVFDATAAAPDAADPAIYCDDEAVTWGQFDARSNALARSLQAAGLETGAKVAQYMRNSPEYLVIFAPPSRRGSRRSTSTSAMGRTRSSI